MYTVLFEIDSIGMTQLQPKTTSEDLLFRLEAFFRSDSSPSEFEKKKMHRDADALMRVAADEGSIIKAGLAALDWDTKNAKYFAENACRLDSSEATALNAALTCRFLNLFSEAASYAALALDRNPASFLSLHHTLEYKMGSGEIPSVIELAKKYETKFETLPNEAAAAMQITEFLDGAKVSHDRLKAELAAALAVLSEHRVRCIAMRWLHGNDPDGRANFVVGLSFKGDLDLEFKLEDQLAEKLSEFGDWDPNVLSIEFHHEAPNAV